MLLCAFRSAWLWADSLVSHLPSSHQSSRDQALFCMYLSVRMLESSPEHIKVSQNTGVMYPAVQQEQCWFQNLVKAGLSINAVWKQMHHMQDKAVLTSSCST